MTVGKPLYYSESVKRTPVVGWAEVLFFQARSFAPSGAKNHEQVWET